MILITGPTAVGKTAVAIAMAKHFGTSIISADSRQCFRELSIGVARPSVPELSEVPHHFIASHSIHEELTAAGFETYALQKTTELFSSYDHVVLAGGTGLYLKAFCEGLDKIPRVSQELRTVIQSSYKTAGIGWLQEQLQQKDPLFYRAGEMQNPQRMMRALEVVETTGRSILDFRNGEKAIRDFEIIRIGLEVPREELYRRINERVDNMMTDGLLAEAAGLLPFKRLNALQTVGYAELFDHLDGKYSLEMAVELIKQHTRNYAKRQLTWFKKMEDMKWFHPTELEEMISYVALRASCRV